MPIGNGIMGAMVFGGVPQERTALNESSFWSGRPHDYDDPNAGRYFVQIRDLVFAGKFQEAEKLADAHFYGIPSAQQAYQPLGDLLLSFAGAQNVEDYRRELDMETGVAKVCYRMGDALKSGLKTQSQKGKTAEFKSFTVCASSFKFPGSYYGPAR